jgi:hypothetical protein
VKAGLAELELWCCEAKEQVNLFFGQLLNIGVFHIGCVSVCVYLHHTYGTLCLL